MPPAPVPARSDRPDGVRVEPARRLAVIGGGASGVLVAIAVLRASDAPVEVLVVEPAARLAEGIAYATRDERHRLNVPVAKLSAASAEPDHFRSWAASRHPGSEPADFLPRSTYGSYLRDTLRRAEHVASGTGSTVRHVRRAAVAVHGGADEAGRRVELDDGSVLRVDAVVLAVGNQASDLPAVLAGVPGVFTSPWQAGALAPLPAGGTALLVGTGLTAVDAALTLAEGGGQDARVVATSRTGLVPFAHLPGLRAPAAAPAFDTEHLEFGALAGQVRAHLAAVDAGDGDWRDAIDGLRPHVQALWRGLSPDDQRRFLREGARWWDVRRHRMAPEVAQRLDRLGAAGRYEVHAGGVERIEPRAEGGFRVTLHDAVAPDGRRELDADRVVACVGFAGRVTDAASPLLRGLLAAGAVEADVHGIGLRADAVGRLHRADGTVDERAYVLGALRRGELWESTAIPELRAQAEAIAGSVVAEFAAAGAAGSTSA